MTKPIRLLLAVSAVLALAACNEPYPVYYAEPAPLQPYLGPPVAPPPPVVKRVVRRHRVRHVRRHRRVQCPCVPAQ